MFDTDEVKAKNATPSKESAMQVIIAACNILKIKHQGGKIQSNRDPYAISDRILQSQAESEAEWNVEPSVQFQIAMADRLHAMYEENKEWFEDSNIYPMPAKPIRNRKKDGQSFNPYNATSLRGLTKEEKHKWFVNNPGVSQSRCPNHKIEVDLEMLRDNLDWEPELEIDPDLCPQRDLKDYADLRKLYFDIETLGLMEDGKAIKPIIGVGFTLHGKFDPGVLYELQQVGELNFYHDDFFEEDIAYWIGFNTNEAALIQRVIEVIKFLKPEVIAAHNGFDFDFPYFQQRCWINDIEAPFGLPYGASLQALTSGEINGNAPHYKESQSFKHVLGFECSLVDTLLLAARYNKIARDVMSLSLKELALYPVQYRKKHRIEIGAEVSKYWEKATNGDKKAMADLELYLLEDIKDQKAVTDHMAQPYYYIGMFCSLSFQSLCLASPPFILNHMTREYYQSKGLNYKPTKDPYRQYEGGMVGANPGIYHDTFGADVKSLYPSIMLRYFLPNNEKDPHNFILSALLKLRDMRYDYKKQAKTAEDRTTRNKYSFAQQAFKIVINGFSGALGVGGYHFNDGRAAALITAYGRVMMEEMIAKLEELNLTIPMWDTDGVAYCYSGSNFGHEVVFNQLQATLPSDIVLEFDTAGDKKTPGNEESPRLGNMAVLARKNYCGFRHNTIDPNIIHKTKERGDTRKRANTVIKTEFLREILRQWTMFGNEAAAKYYCDVQRQLAAGEWPLSQLLITKKIPKSDRTLTAAKIGDHGQRITYYWGCLRRFSSTKTGKTRELKTVRYPILVHFEEDDFERQNPITIPVAVGAEYTIGNKSIQIDPSHVSFDYAAMVSSTCKTPNNTKARSISDGYVASIRDKYHDLCLRLGFDPVDWVDSLIV